MAGLSFNQQFAAHGQWREGFAARLQALRQWLQGQHLLDAAVQEQMQRLEAQVRDDRVSVAFVAEFSRGKSELINAVFFAQYGRRIMPASPGRTTMCPTELGYDPQEPPSLRLLPITTRLHPHSLGAWRRHPSVWTEIALDVNDPQQLATAMAQVAKVRKVSTADAQRLGFWHDGAPDNPPLNEHGLVEVPQWRHALVNLDHPLLRQGLVVVDTPGLNAVGSEPELTVNLIAQAHAVVFMLAADTGVTRSDLTIWQQHLMPKHRQSASHLVVLNKADTLWDGITPQDELNAQLERQRIDCARMLQISPQRILPLSAQKGLRAKFARQPQLLAMTGLPQFEDMLAQRLLSSRHSILAGAVAEGVEHVQAQVRRLLTIRQRDLYEQIQELRGLRGKNQALIANMRQRIAQEQQAFDGGASRVQPLRESYHAMLEETRKLLSDQAVRAEMAQLTQAIEQSRIKLNLRSVYEAMFGRLQCQALLVHNAATEMRIMLDKEFRQLNAEFGFSLQAPPVLALKELGQELAQVQESYLQYVGLGQAVRLADPQAGQRLVTALATRLQQVFGNASQALDWWGECATSALDAQCQQRKRSLAQRLEAVDRVQGAASGLDARVMELEGAMRQQSGIEQRLAQWTQQLLVPIAAAPREASAHQPTEPASA